MASTNTIETRIQLKRDIEINWDLVGNIFIPLAGEIIIYSPDSSHDFSRIKIGDGSTNIASLPFVNEDLETELNNHITNTSQHITDVEREQWNDKINCSYQANDHMLVLTHD